jgi:hypothetical protein
VINPTPINCSRSAFVECRGRLVYLHESTHPPRLFSNRIRWIGRIRRIVQTGKTTTWLFELLNMFSTWFLTIRAHCEYCHRPIFHFSKRCTQGVPGRIRWKSKHTPCHGNTSRVHILTKYGLF